MFLVLLLACEMPAPSFVDKRAIDVAERRADSLTICTGLKMKDESTRGYAAEKLATAVSIDDCLCETLTRDGAWDLPVVRGMAKGEDDAHVGCAANLLDDPKLADRAGLVNVLVRIKVPMVQARLKVAAKSDTDVAVRAAAMAVLRVDKDPEALALVMATLTDPNPTLRAAAATALAGVEAAKEGLVAATKDESALVRGAALASLRSMKGFAFAEVACPALRADADPSVRAAAATAMKGTKDEAMLACLREHMLEREDDASVRAAMLATLQGTSAQPAADALCEAIPFWIHSYIGEEHPDREGPSDIIFAQNNRDFNVSYDCVQRALKAGGYKTCEQKFYINDWFHELGGKNAAPRPCGAKGAGGGGGGGGSREIVF